jgi:predicted HicB family RNase H-like nuclease
MATKKRSTPPIVTPKAAGRNKYGGFLLRETEHGEYAAWKRAAVKLGKSLTQWAREVLNEAAKK